MPHELNRPFIAAEGLPPEVGGLMSTRRGGVSRAPFDSLNLRPAKLGGDAVDEPAAIHENQRRFAGWLEGAQPVYLDQVHGTGVVRLTRADLAPGRPFHRADASLTTERGVACTVLVADCLPVLLAAPGGRGVAAAHAGWRGLAGGVAEAALAALCEAAECSPAEVSAWLGACIGPAAFEVGGEVREAFGDRATQHFRPGAAPGRWWADLPGLARQRLQEAGVAAIAGGHWCTHSDPARFFSFRRDRVTGRQAAAVWIR
ncbi:peptidoglycan editing factor PgeF [Ideonella sp.]|uniref:peptidoglycan editing factor PgeF n=1 Tax=Ideonella sp. TaxID=1929293 RepID=UPI002B487461|nr:peptidoglycan editing factor PgeF [Ideonella sp.]HJV69313.1 peptidoglycan editing factor PgeF [Ideonella sp.]